MLMDFSAMLSALSFLNTLSSYAANGYIRYPILLEGSKQWCESLLDSFFIQQSSRFTKIELYGDLTISKYAAFPIKSALKKLGQETDCLVIDISHEFNANAINAVCGTVIGGGLVFFIRTDDSSLPTVVDQWFSQYIEQMVSLKETETSYELPLIPRLKDEAFKSDAGIHRSSDQERAVKAIQKVVTGHSKRPLVITADRGRGKSSAIGIAIAELAMERSLIIGVTAPLRNSIDEIFKHAERVASLNGLKVESQKNQLMINESQIIYIAPDELLRNPQALDLLCVDEAAAIPAPMLLSFVDQYSRMVFSTTINGYEGTGRGFEVKFKKQLYKKRPNTRSLEMKHPIRWSNNDPLEAWLSSVFLLNHEEQSNSLSIDTPMTTIDYRCISVSQLVNQDDLAQSLFSLLVSAHYQTSPNDWISLLTDPTLRCWIGIEKSTNKLVCCALLSKEGELDLDIINAAQLGKRRPKGHLAAISLTQTLCIDEPAFQSSIRVMRIAVDPSYQQRGIGSKFINAIENNYKAKGVDYLSTSFGSTAELNHFWYKLNFHFVRLGISKDKASGTHSLLAIKPLSHRAFSWVSIGNDYFTTSFPEQLMSTFSSLDYNDVLSLLKGVSFKEKFSPLINKRLEIFALGGLGYELLQYELRYFILSHLSALALLSEAQKKLAVTKILQVKQWSVVIEECNLIGKKNAELQLRELVKSLLTNLQCKS
ncbi:GNAT family N-acetyltransferase [Aliivibrio sp. S4TY2]|uniref:GNAT family N-acetyltransferase n=2 Tax=unclassified Aliivibrio TaxID=2645654 RepID=UPI0023790515|nr:MULTISPECIES: GNAT family N-acetyltransferase [unclassified Aliivibrio]MDD9155195.1 GNAT family N-acetyltransferase [Aliivibrio sp. S4TY2]MDD9159253.1 GNAT family N-acetyltransferase [Aliivibrio sp. S4TY1]MDD9167252.1 GNAT family N-acetyltransferase [Aliivibrio sp. S4MY4]MDD9184274.1 GNAT family N-acetyltransferase [Aliivibrio sp. S4MY3]